MGVKWDEETDVVVVGCGLAGAVSAVEAHDCGAGVLVLEKAEYPGGLSILSGGQIKFISDVEAAIPYLKIISANRTDEALIRPFAKGLHDNMLYLQELCQINGARVQAREGEKEHSRGIYPLPGQEAFYEAQVTTIPGFKGFSWVQHRTIAAVNLMKVAFDHLEKRNVKVRTSTVARRLVTDISGAVVGVVVQSEGKESTIQARRAVILATGGFEQNRWLQIQYLQGMPFYSIAPLTHTGDGILMAQKIGAALWHMWHVHGSYGFKFRDFPIAFRHVFGGQRNPKRVMPWIVVDKLGARYMNEYHPAPQDTMHRPMELFDPDLVGYPHIPSYIIFDEVGRKRGPIAQPLSLGQHVYHWSKDNEEEVKKGWILRASTVRGLGEMIKLQPENEGLMDIAALELTVSQWNEAVSQGVDKLRRLPGTMMSIQSPPFYAVPVWPIISNTQGGPMHNVKQQVLDPFGQPIPRLYAIGELGSFFGHLYELSGNLGECLYSGRVAGREAAREY